MKNLALTVFASLLVLGSRSCLAADPWVRYENRHFVAYSDAREKRARGLLDRLESFRAAFMQFGNVTAPPNAPKAIVLIFATTRDFQSIARNRVVAGFATSDGRTPLIVMPAQGDTNFTEDTIRHEYGHILLGYKGFHYPAWFNEGFAEMVSAVELIDDGKAFRVGRAPTRVANSLPPIFPWDKLLSDGFNPHELDDIRTGSSAYMQAWMLVHYALLGNGLQNAKKLQAYFDGLKADEDSPEAFEAAFGLRIADLWESTLKPYMKRTPFYTFQFRPNDLDLQFAATSPGASDVPNLIHWLGIQKASLAGTAQESFPPATLAGRWTRPRLDMACDAPLVIAVAAEGTGLQLEFPQSQAGNLHGAQAYSYEVRSDGLLRLELANEPAAEDSSLHLKRPKADLLCIGRTPADAMLCDGVLVRCGQ